MWVRRVSCKSATETKLPLKIFFSFAIADVTTHQHTGALIYPGTFSYDGTIHSFGSTEWSKKKNTDMFFNLSFKEKSRSLYNPSWTSILVA
jgi:hypothetical protein